MAVDRTDELAAALECTVAATRQIRDSELRRVSAESLKIGDFLSCGDRLSWDSPIRALFRRGLPPNVGDVRPQPSRQLWADSETMLNTPSNPKPGGRLVPRNR